MHFSAISIPVLDKPCWTACSSSNRLYFSTGGPFSPYMGLICQGVLCAYAGIYMHPRKGWNTQGGGGSNSEQAGWLCWSDVSLTLWPCPHGRIFVWGMLSHSIDCVPSPLPLPTQPSRPITSLSGNQEDGRCTHSPLTCLISTEAACIHHACVGLLF